MMEMMEMMERDGQGWQYLLMAMASASAYQFSKTAPPTSANIRGPPKEVQWKTDKSNDAILK